MIGRHCNWDGGGPTVWCIWEEGGQVRGDVEGIKGGGLRHCNWDGGGPTVVCISRGEFL